MVSESEEDNIALPRESPARILQRQARERAELKKRIERIRSCIPKKDRAGRARAAEDAAEEEKHLLDAQAAERLEHGLEGELAPQGVKRTDAVSSVAAGGEPAPFGRNESKAARRRRKKAEKEAESQRRIEDEKANMGPTLKSVESQAIEAQLKPKSLRIYPVAPDGHCLYNAIAHQISLAEFESPVPASVDALRSATADYLFAHKDDYMPFLESIDGDDERFRHYCEELRNEATWGGQVELKVLAEMLGVEIEVYAADMPVVRMGRSQAARRTFRVSFHRHYYGLGEHYNSVTLVT